MKFNKALLSNFLLLVSALALVLELGCFASVGLTVVGLMDFSKFYLPLILVLGLVDWNISKSTPSQQTKKILLLNAMYIIILFILIGQFSY